MIGFASTSYSVLESTGSAVVTVSVLSGTLGRGTQVGVLFSTTGGTATCELPLMSALYTCILSTSTQCHTFNYALTYIHLHNRPIADHLGVGRGGGGCSSPFKLGQGHSRATAMVGEFKQTHPCFPLSSVSRYPGECKLFL